MPLRIAEYEAAGVAVKRNPGCGAVWATRVYQAFRAPRPGGGVGVLFDIGSRPERVSWWAEGRPATRAEVEESIRTGLPILLEQSGGEGDPKAAAELSALAEAAKAHLPA